MLSPGDSLATPQARNPLSGSESSDRRYTTENVLKVTPPAARSEETTLNAALQHHDVPLDARRGLLGPRFAWNPPSSVGSKQGFSRYLRRRSSATSLSSLAEGTPEQPVKIRGSVPSLDRFWSEILFPFMRDLFSISWIGFVLWSCALVAKLSIVARVVAATVGLVAYVVENFSVWLLIAPISTGTLKAKLWFSHKQLKRLEHQFDYPSSRDRAKFSIKHRNTEASPHSLHVPSVGSRVSLSYLSPAPKSVNKATVNRAQSALGALPMLVWSAQAANATPHRTPDTRIHSEGVEEEPRPSVVRWQPTNRSTPISGRASVPATAQDLLQAISQPDIGFLDKRNVMFHPNLPGRRLPQIREERAREAGRLFSEGDWQAMLDVEAAASTVRKRDKAKDWFLLFRAKLHQNLMSLTAHPAIILATILRNVAWCATFLWALTMITRPDHTHSWNYDSVSNVFWWLESIFQWQLTMDYVLAYLAATEKLKYLFSLPALVEILSLPAMQVVIQTLSGHTLVYYTTTFGAIRFFRLFRMEKQISSIFPWLEPVKLIITGLAVDTGVVVMAFACSMWVAEGPQPTRNFVNILDYVYYSIVTMTTVGYGDYSPTTRIARWITSTAILAGFIIFPYHVQRLLSAFHIPPVIVGHMPSITADFIFIYGKMRPRQLGCMIHEVCESLPGSVRHILVVTPFPASSFHHIVQNALRQHRIHVCVSQKYPNSDEMQMYCALARAVFIIADPKPQDPRSKGNIGTYAALVAEDQKAFLRLAKAQPWCWPNVPVSIQLAHGMYSGLAMELGAYHVIPLEWLKLRSIGKSVAGCQGFIPLCFNMYHTPSKSSLIWRFFEMIESHKEGLENSLSKETQLKSPRAWRDAQAIAVSSTDGADDSESDRGTGYFRQRLKKLRRPPSEEKKASVVEDKAIRDELNFYYYFRGLRYQVYRFEFPSCMDGLDFSLVVRLLYRRFNVFLIGLVSIDKRFVMSPIGYTIGAERRGSNLGSYPLAGVVLAPSLHDINHLSKIKVFHVSSSTVDAEKKFLSRNLRSKDDLQQATLSFMEDMSKTKFPTPNRSPQEVGYPGIDPRGSLASIDTSYTQGRPLDEIVIKEVASAVEAFDLSTGSKPFILCCGWPKDLFQFLSAIETNRPSYVLVLAAQDAPSFARWNRDLWDFRSSCAWLHGSPLNMEDLKNAGALLAQSIIILSSRHAFSVDEEERTCQLTTVDNQTILVRQQIFALFARVNEYLRHWDQSESERTFGDASAVVSEDDNVDHGGSEKLKVRVPFIITELQDKESVEYLSSPKDLFLLSAFRNLQNKKSRLDGQSLLTTLAGQDYGDDVEWAAEGGRNPSGASELLFSATRMPLDSWVYAIQSEFRSGQLYIRELGYASMAFCLPVSRFAIDTTFIEHLVDGTHAPLADLIAKRIRGQPGLQRYRTKSPLSLMAIPKMFVGAPFKDAFSYLMKMELKLAVAILRRISPPTLTVANPIESLRGAGAQELVISCPAPSMPLSAGDRLYVLAACPKHIAGLFFLEKPPVGFG